MYIQTLETQGLAAWARLYVQASIKNWMASWPKGRGFHNKEDLFTCTYKYQKSLWKQLAHDCMYKHPLKTSLFPV
jgi:hypothetical protein